MQFPHIQATNTLSILLVSASFHAQTGMEWLDSFDEKKEIANRSNKRAVRVQTARSHPSFLQKDPHITHSWKKGL